MQLTKTNDSYKRLINVDGLLTVAFEHEIKSTKANFEWKGPKIDKELWKQVLAFLKWTFDTTKSESQMRLFVNTKTQMWAAWAFPQICGTSMTTKEVEESSEGWTKQRAQFPDSEGWSLFGTVHHHCGMTAFQSGTDEYNEKSQDGLHITVGKMDEKQHDIHCRLYIAGNCWNPDMSLLWDVTEMMNQIPKWALEHTNKDLPNLVARWEMTLPAPADTKFPDEWRANMIEDKPIRNTVVGDYYHHGAHHGAYDPRNQQSYFAPGMTKKQRKAWKKAQQQSLVSTAVNLDWDLRRATEDVVDLIAEHQGNDVTDILTTLDNLENCGPLSLEVMQICIEHDVSIMGLYDYIEKKCEEAEAKAAMKEADEEANKQLAEGGAADPGKGTVPLDPETQAQEWANAYGCGC